MALKGDRRILMDEVRYACNVQVTAANIGVVAIYTGSGPSGVNPDGSGYTVTVSTASASGAVPAGLVMHPVVSGLDETRYRLNAYNGERRLGDKTTLLKKGSVWTDRLKTGDTPGQGSGAYLAASGLLTVTSGVGIPQVGVFGSQKTSDGFALVHFDIY